MTTDTSGSTAEKTVRVVLAEGDATARDRLASELSGLKDIDLVAVEAGGTNAIIAAYRLHPDIVLLDLASPDRAAPDTIKHLLRVCPGVSVAMLVEQEEDARLTPALDAGARESLPKSAPAEAIEAIVRRLGDNRPRRA